MVSKSTKNPRRTYINTTVGEFVEAVYDAAMEEFMDEIIARRVAMQMLLRKLREQKKVQTHMKEDAELIAKKKLKEKSKGLRKKK